MQPDNYSTFVAGAGGRYVFIIRRSSGSVLVEHPAYNGLRAVVTTGLSQFYPGRRRRR